MQYYGKLETRPFRDSLFIKKTSTREQSLQNNHKLESIPKYFNKIIDTSKSGPPKATLVINKPKVNSVRFVDPYVHISTMYHNNESTHLANANE